MLLNLLSIRNRFVIKCYIFSCVFSIIFIAYFTLNKNPIKLDPSNFYDFYVRPTNRTEKIIFLRTPFQGNYKGYWGDVGPVMSNCRDTRINGKCLITNHPDYIENADIVLFSIEDIQTIQMQSKLEIRKDLEATKEAFPSLSPEIRQKQLWILYWLESNEMLDHYRHFTPEFIRQFNGIFNGTLSYLRDSTVMSDYSSGCKYVQTKKIQYNKQDWKKYKQSAISKPRLISWLVSHCNAPNKREKYVALLNEITPVDIYGRCAKDFGLTNKIPQYSEEEKDLLKSYKFYLSFENTHCPEYVTEKIYRIINSDISHNPPVPIVMGPNKKFYEEILPSNSFIHVDDFDSAEDLGNYLTELNTQPSQYFKYLKFRNHNKLVCDKDSVPCKLCNILLERNRLPYHEILTLNQNDLIISNFEEFWNKAKCRN